MSARRSKVERDGTFAGSTPGRAIIDIGSNTVRMVVYGGSMRAPTVLLNEKVTAQLGRDIASTSPVSGFMATSDAFVKLLPLKAATCSCANCSANR